MKISNIKKHKIKHLKDFMDLGILSNTAFLSGGAAMSIIDKNHKFDDYDIFFTQKIEYTQVNHNSNVVMKSVKNITPPDKIISGIAMDGLEKVFTISQELYDTSIKLTDMGFDLVHRCPFGRTYTYVKDKMKIQLIQGTDGDIESILHAFDMYQCQVAFDGENLFTNSIALKCIRRKLIKFSWSVKNPIRTISRVLKYHKDKGYNVEVSEIYRLCSNNSYKMSGDYVINDLGFYL